MLVGLGSTQKSCNRPTHMRIRQLLLAIVSTLLLTAGFAKAAESFDVVAKSGDVTQTVNVDPGFPCVLY